MTKHHFDSKLSIAIWKHHFYRKYDIPRQILPQMLTIKETNGDDQYSSETHHVSERVKQNFNFAARFVKVS